MAGVIEEVARAQCESHGFVPDEVMPNGGPRWHYYVPGVEVAIRTLLSGPVGDVLRAAQAVSEDGRYHSKGVFFASPTWMQIVDSLDALPSEITDMLGGE